MAARTFADFQAAFPNLYRDVRSGFECRPGWVGIVWRLSEKLEPLGVQCAQVKEKFGGLCFYLEDRRGIVKAASKFILSAELEAEHTCEICGKQPAQLRNWTLRYVRTLCEEHTPKDVEQNVPRVLTDPEGFASEFREAIAKKAEP